MVRAIFLGIAVALLAGCASSGIPVERFGPESLAGGKGAVIFSATATQKCLGLAENLRLTEITHPKDQIAVFGINAELTASDFPDRVGGVHVIALPPGTYFLALSGGPRVHVQSTSDVQFDVNPGEVSYLGEFFLRTNCTAYNQSSVGDQSTRDLALVHARNPALDVSTVRKHIFVPIGTAPH